MNNVQFQRRIFQEKEVTLQSVIELASTMELSSKDVSRMHSKPIEEPVHQLTDMKVKPCAEVSCFCCGGQHLVNKYRFIDAICCACSKKGHIAKVCCRKNKQSIKCQIFNSQGQETGFHSSSVKFEFFACATSIIRL